MEMRCRKVEQITLLVENRPGILAELCAHLSERGISVNAISTHESADTTKIRLLVDDVELAKKIAAAGGVPYTSAECLELRMPNEPGAISAAARKLALAGINIDYLYGTTAPGATTGRTVFGVSDIERALDLDW